MTSTSKLRVAIVEDEPADAADLARIIKSDPRLECVAVCTTGEEALKVLPEKSPQIILMDLRLPKLSGIDCARRLCRMLPGVELMALTTCSDSETLFDAIRAGCKGYLLKTSPAEDVVEAIFELAGGGAPMSREIARRVIDELQGGAVRDPSLDGLTATENKVLKFLASGWMYKEIAEKMGIGLPTVRSHIYHIYRKLNVHSRHDAAQKLNPGFKF